MVLMSVEGVSVLFRISNGLCEMGGSSDFVGQLHNIVALLSEGFGIVFHYFFGAEDPTVEEVGRQGHEEDEQVCRH